MKKQFTNPTPISTSLNIYKLSYNFLGISYISASNFKEAVDKFDKWWKKCFPSGGGYTIKGIELIGESII